MFGSWAGKSGFLMNCCRNAAVHSWEAAMKLERQQRLVLCKHLFSTQHQANKSSFNPPIAHTGMEKYHLGAGLSLETATAMSVPMCSKPVAFPGETWDDCLQHATHAWWDAMGTLGHHPGFRFANRQQESQSQESCWFRLNDIVTHRYPEIIL